MIQSSLFALRADFAHLIVAHLGVVFAANFALISPVTFAAIQTAPKIISHVRRPLYLKTRNTEAHAASSLLAIKPLDVLPAFPGLREIDELSILTHGTTGFLPTLDLMGFPNTALSDDFLATVRYCKTCHIHLNLTARRIASHFDEAEWRAFIDAPLGTCGSVSIQQTHFFVDKIIVDGFCIAATPVPVDNSPLPQLQHIESVKLNIIDFVKFAAVNREALLHAVRYPGTKLQSISFTLGVEVSEFFLQVKLHGGRTVTSELHCCRMDAHTLPYLRALF
eukprot:gnl/Ergobibamus_cyprinoides/3624.p1 GENE.gnl/Ergobibamus_cyprinoides/3624~~gnl/Ergobibamus_cyprinoides/3624.p1  ORF type:complete len:279 (-),score=63.40 gnl/Ergobibamus_cyprinoides/3624:206-1042(-)